MLSGLEIQIHEQHTSLGWHEERRIHPDVGRQTETLESGGAALCGLGNLSYERFAG